MISVIIPAFNEEQNLKRLLPHLNQLAEGHDVEIVVSTGSCTVNYSDLVGQLGRGRLIANQRKGRAKQMNDGVAVAKGSVLVFLHADVMPPNGFFEAIKRTLSEGYDAGFFSYRFDKKSFFLEINASFTKRDGLFTGGGDQCLFIKKSAFENLGRFNEDQVLMEDFELFKRMKKNSLKYRIVNNDLTVSARKYHNNSYLRVNLTNLFLVLLFNIGVSPNTLKSLHGRLLRLDYQKKSTT